MMFNNSFLTIKTRGRVIISRKAKRKGSNEREREKLPETKLIKNIINNMKMTNNKVLIRCSRVALLVNLQQNSSMIDRIFLASYLSFH